MTATQTNVLPALSIRELSVEYAHPSGPVRAVSDVSFEVARGSSIALVGESGCGKTTLARAVMGILPPTGTVVSGSVALGPTDITSSDALASARWNRIAMVFQNAMSTLNPVMKAGAQVAEAIQFHQGVSATTARARVRDLFEQVGIPARRFDAYPHELSGGMKQRVVIALALSCDAEVVIADEPTTALDVVVQEQIIELLESIREDRGLTLVVVSHDLGVVKRLCANIAVMYAGRVVESGPMAEVTTDPSHPYTSALLSAYPSIIGPRRRLTPLAGGPPDLGRLPSGCSFHPRCPHSQPTCLSGKPEPEVGPSGRLIECHFPLSVRTRGARRWEF